MDSVKPVIAGASYSSGSDGSSTGLANVGRGAAREVSAEVLAQTFMAQIADRPADFQAKVISEMATIFQIANPDKNLNLDAYQLDKADKEFREGFPLLAGLASGIGVEAGCLGTYLGINHNTLKELEDKYPSDALRRNTEMLKLAVSRFKNQGVNGQPMSDMEIRSEFQEALRNAGRNDLVACLLTEGLVR